METVAQRAKKKSNNGEDAMDMQLQASVTDWIMDASEKEDRGESEMIYFYCNPKIVEIDIAIALMGYT